MKKLLLLLFALASASAQIVAPNTFTISSVSGGSGGGGTGADPTGTISSTVGTFVNGSATTFLRSDGAPTLPPTIVGLNAITAAAANSLALSAGSGNNNVTITATGTGAVVVAAAGTNGAMTFAAGAGDKTSGLGFASDSWLFRKTSGQGTWQSANGSASFWEVQATTAGADATFLATSLSGGTAYLGTVGTANDIITGSAVGTGAFRAHGSIMFGPNDGALALTLNTDLSAVFASTIAAVSITSNTRAVTQAIGDNSTKIATTAYVDASVADDIEIKNPVVAATNAALLFSPSYSNGSSGVGATLTGGIGVLVVDGYTPVLNDRILVKNEASTLTQGVYTLTRLGTIGIGYILTRATDFNQAANILYGDTVGVLQGTANANQQFTMNNQNAITVGTTAITFAQTSGGSQLTNGNGITITGNSVAVNTAVTATMNVANSFTASQTFNNSLIFPYSAMAGTVIDVTLPVNTKSIATGTTVSFSNATPTAGTRTTLEVTADSTARVLTMPTVFSINRSGNITTVTVPASGTLTLVFEYTGARWNIYGDPVATTGTGTSFMTNLNPSTDGITNTGLLVQSGVIAPTSLSADTIDWNPSGLSDAAEIQISTDANLRYLAGIAGGASGRTIRLTNTSANTLLLKDKASGLETTAANAFNLGGYDLPLLPNDSMELVYDGTNSYWRAINPFSRIIPSVRFGTFSRRSQWSTTTADSEMGLSTVSGSGGTSTATTADVYFGYEYLHGVTATANSGKAGAGAGGSPVGVMMANNRYWRFTGIFRLTASGGATSTQYTARAGFSDSWSTSTANNGVYVIYDSNANSGNWQLVLTKGGTATTQNTSTAPAFSATATMRIDIVVTGTRVEAYQNGTLMTSGTTTTVTNMPIVGVGPGVNIVNGASGTTSYVLDVGAIEVVSYYPTP